MADGVIAEDATNAHEVPDVGYPHIVVDVVYIRGRCGIHLLGHEYDPREKRGSLS
jgi:hypothetical protein